MEENKNVDPVSGNKVPFGARPEEVRDDIPIMASENEYIIPANVVRFIGLDKIEKMVSKAKEELAKMGEQVDEEDDSLPFDPTELQAVPHMAEGGVVEGGFKFPQESGYTGVKEYKDKDGNSMYVPFMNGQPLYQVPEGYTEGTQPKGGDPASKANQMADKTTQPLPLLDRSANENGKFVEQNKSALAGSPNDWTVDDFINFGRNRDSVGNNAIKGMISMMPGGKLAVQTREKWLDREVSKQFDSMLDSGLDPLGNPITPEQKTQLLSTRENLKKQMDGEVGIGFSPVESLTNAVQRFTSFIGGEDKMVQPRSSMSDTMTKSLSSSAPKGYTYSGGDQKLGSNMGGGKDSQYSGSTLGGAGNSNGTSSRSAIDNAKSGSGGLYAEGGLITRPNRTKK